MDKKPKEKTKPNAHYKKKKKNSEERNERRGRGRV
jgi:hypothetical protein